MRPKKFPKEFLWGTATSAYQIEGDNFSSDWHNWADRGKVPEAGKAADHIHHLKEDVGLMKQCGANAYRMSIEWSRICPQIDKVDQDALEYYKNEVKSLHQDNITVFLTLNHFTLPQWFLDLGGWENRKNLKYFKGFVEIICQAFGNIEFWTTINEPTVYVMQAYYSGVFPPGQKSLLKTWRVLNNLILAHKEAYKIIRQKIPNAKIGIAQNALCLSPWPRDGILFRLVNFFIKRYWNHYFFRKSRKMHDYIGLNYYFHYYLKVGLSGIKIVSPSKLKLQLNQRGWEVYPAGIKELCLDFKKYKRPIYILENGIATTNDEQRQKFLLTHLGKLLEAMEFGADVRGYFYWSLIDNYEWEAGFGPKFGLAEVDFKTFKRKLRPSGLVFANMVKNNSIDYDQIKEVIKE